MHSPELVLISVLLPLDDLSAFILTGVFDVKDKSMACMDDVGGLINLLHFEELVVIVFDSVSEHQLVSLVGS